MLRTTGSATGAVLIGLLQVLTAFEVARDPGGGLWRFTQPLNARVDNVRFDQLISSIATTPVIEFISDQLLADPEIYGFNPPTHEIFFRRGTNEIVAHLQIGRVLTNKLDQIYVRNLTRTNLVTLPASMIQDLKLPLNDFRDRRLLPSLDSVDQIEFQTTGGAGVAQRLGTNWWVMKPGRFPASTGEIERQLTVLRGLEILDFPADVAPRPELFGLAKPIRRYVLSTTITNAGLATNRTIVDFNFGSSPRGDRIYARRSDETAVYTVPNLLVVLVETPNQLRDWRFELSQIVRIEIKHTNVVRELARSGSGGNWNEPARSNQSFSKETSEFIDELLFRLSTNESDRYAIRDEKPFLDSGGFRQRTHEITLHFREGSEFLRRLRVRFGGVIGNRNLALAYFDDDPVGIRVTIPEKLYGDIYLTLGGR